MIIDVLAVATDGRPMTVGELRRAIEDQDDTAPVLLALDGPDGHNRAAGWLTRVEADLGAGTIDLRTANLRTGEQP